MSFKTKIAMFGLTLLISASVVLVHAPAHAQDKLRFAVGPFQPTAGDTKRAYEPFFKHLADKLGRDYPGSCIRREEFGDGRGVGR